MCRFFGRVQTQDFVTQWQAPTHTHTYTTSLCAIHPFRLSLVAFTALRNLCREDLTIMSLKVQNCIVDEGLDLPEPQLAQLAQFALADLDLFIQYDKI